MEIKNEIDKLAEIIQREFGVVREDITKLDNKIDRLEGEVGGLKNEMGELKSEVGGMKNEMGGLKNEMGELKSEVGGLKNEMGELKSEVGGLEGEVGGLRNEMDEGFNKVLDRDDKIFKRLEDLETDNTMGAGASRRQEDKLENHEGRIVVVEEKLGVGGTV